MLFGEAAQRFALPAGGWDETAPFCRNQLEDTQTARKRGDSHPSGARCVGLLSQIERGYSMHFVCLPKTLPTAHGLGSDEIEDLVSWQLER